MWCAHCRQDLPHVAHPAGGGKCLQCGAHALPHASAAPADSDSKLAEAAYGRSMAGLLPAPWSLGGFDDLEIRSQVRRARRLIESQERLFGGGEGLAKRGTKGVEEREGVDRDELARGGTKGDRERAWRECAVGETEQGAWAWGAVGGGVVMSACGLGLIGWSMWSADATGWRWGVGIALSGQLLLTAGALLRPARWQRSGTTDRVEVDFEARRVNEARGAAHGSVLSG